MAFNAISTDEAQEFTFELSKIINPDESLYPNLVLSSACTATNIYSFIVGSKGEIYKCWNDVGDEKRVIGNIAEDNLLNPNLLYRYVVGYKWYHNEDCKKCFYLPVCSGQCAWYVLRNQYENGKYNTLSMYAKNARYVK